MAFNLPKQTQNLNEDEVTFFPMSPSSQSVNNSILSLTVVVVVELETLLNETGTAEMIHNIVLPQHARFSAVMDVDEKGAPCWKKVDVKVEDHIIIPTFPQCLSVMEYDEKLKEYVSKIAIEPLPKNQPLWAFHLVKYPSRNGVGSLVFKFSHAIGDGFSIITAVLGALKRADDPSLPLTIPNMSLKVTKGQKSLWSYVSMCINTVYDLGFAMLKGTFLEDSRTVVRSGMRGVEFEPIAISSTFISMERLKQVKYKVGGTVNDVLTGVIYYTIHLYIARKGDFSSGMKMNLLVMFNTRILRGYNNIVEMIKDNVWSNRVTFLHAPIPCIRGEERVDPLVFVTKGKKVMERKKNSMLTHLTNPVLNALSGIRGPKGVAEFVHANFRNTTATVSNLIGPSEKMSLSGHPVGSCYFMVAGIPQSLVFSMMTYMGELRITTTMEKNFIDSEIFKSCMKEAFENIFEAACGGVKSK